MPPRDDGSPPSIAPRLRVLLRPHPSAPSSAVQSLHAGLTLVGRELLVAFDLVGDVGALRIPEPSHGLDPERLWEHTCFELFVARASGGTAGEGYEEHNLSPSGQRARFEFSGYRQRIRAWAPAQGSAPSLSIALRRLRLEAAVPLPEHLGSTARLSPTAVIEDAAGGLSYWAVHHPAERPDFHHRDGFALALSLSASPTITHEPPEHP